MPLDPRYITSVELQSYFVNKANGLPLAGGLVYFWEDNNRNNPKPVFELTGAPPNYTYTALPNPLTLSAVGTFIDPLGNDIAVYYFPYDNFGNVDNYFIQVYDPSAPPPMGTPQFTREAWPNVTGGSGIVPPGSTSGSQTNLLSNPQFAFINFNPTQPFLIPYNAGTTIVDFAPDWSIVITASAGGTVTMVSNSIAGSSHLPTNPPYTLSVTAGPNINDLILRQRLRANPDIWSAVTPGGMGFVATSLLLYPSVPPQTVIVNYVPSNAAATTTTILTATNLTGTPQIFNATTQLPQGDNTDDSNNGWVDIDISLPVVGTTTLSSVQVVGLDVNTPMIGFDQTPINRQADQEFHYYFPQLLSKPIPSYLVGWDFPLNPAQFDGNTVPATAIGANKSKYVWDQTIIFQSVDSGVGVTRAPNGSIRLTAALAGQMAMVQYLDQAQARKILHDAICCHVAASTNQINGYLGTVSLWYTTDANLPNVATGTNNSLILTLDPATGKPATFNGNWTEVPRNIPQNAFFEVTTPIGTNPNDYYLTGWDLINSAAANTATFFAIVIGFVPLLQADYIDIYQVGLYAGQLPPRPSPKTQDEVLRDCERYYEKSYAQGTQPNAITLVNALTAPMISNGPIAGQSYCLPQAFGFEYRTLKRTVNPVVTLYSPTSGTAGSVNSIAYAAFTTPADLVVGTYWTLITTGDKYCSIAGPLDASITNVLTTNATTPAIYTINYHYTVDARLGIVN